MIEVKDFLSNVERHLAHAKSKHPDFCKKLLVSENVGDVKRFERVCRQAYDNDPCAENALMEEISEMLTSICEGDKEHAVYEGYDAITVILRIIEVLEK